MDGLRFGDGYAVMFFFFREKWIGSLFKIKVYGQITSVEWSRLAKKYRRKNYTFSGGLREWRRVCVRWMVVLTGAGEKISAEEEIRSGWCDVCSCGSSFTCLWTMRRPFVFYLHATEVSRCRCRMQRRNEQMTMEGKGETMQNETGGREGDQGEGEGGSGQVIK